MPVRPEVLRDLNVPTPEERIKQRPMSRRPNSPMLDYVDARYVQDVLDETVGPENWQSAFQSSDMAQGVRCGIGIHVEYGEIVVGDTGEVISDTRHSAWVWKWDVGHESDIEPIKGAHSGAFKRAGVQWGIARDLYDADKDEAPMQVAQPQAAPVQSQRPPAAARPLTTMADFQQQQMPVPMEQGNGTYPWICPVHHEVRVQPGTEVHGRMGANGKPYASFYSCPERTCSQRPPRGLVVEPQHIPAA